jgi:predicted HicB family RNase H-like nuclease
MKQETANHRGYTASVYWSDEYGCFVGDVLGLTRTTFDIQGPTFEEACADFRGFIDLYLADCVNDGIEPEKPQELHHPKRAKKHPELPPSRIAAIPKKGAAHTTSE